MNQWPNDSIRSAAFAIDHAELVCFQNLLDLVAGVDGPGANVVELYVGAPVEQGAAWLFEFFVGQGKVVVRVGVGGGEGDGGGIGFHCFAQASGFIEDVAQIKISQGVARINFNCAAIVLLGHTVITAVVIQSAQVDMGGGVFGIKFQCLLVGGDRLLLGGGVFLETDAFGEEL